MSLSIYLKPIGVVEKGLECCGEGKAARSRYEQVSIIKIFDEFVDGLEGLEEYSHVIVVYWMHKVSEVRLRVRPWGIERFPTVGIFATRFPPRPNPIGVTVAEPVSIEKPLIKVKGLDAWTETPVLNIKPYDNFDIVKKPMAPWWFKEMWSTWKKKWRYEEIAPWLGPCTED
jgi:tRNA-Thr(GGU) m(6)t(6)A37 methyltransferase TsaA